jgi:hypothetical protein
VPRPPPHAFVFQECCRGFAGGLHTLRHLQRVVVERVGSLLGGGLERGSEPSGYGTDNGAGDARFECIDGGRVDVVSLCDALCAT